MTIPFPKPKIKKHGLEIVALGTGNCNRLEYPSSPKRNSPLFAIIIDGQAVAQFDCSAGSYDRLAALDCGIPSCILNSHPHTDHDATLTHLVEMLCSGQPAPTIFMTREAHQRWPELLEYHYPGADANWYRDYSPQVLPFDHGMTQLLDRHDDFFVQAFTVSHGACPALGFRLYTPYGHVAYTGDTGFFPELLGPHINGVDLLIADCSVPITPGTDPTGRHMSPYECGQLALLADAKTLWMTHYSGKDSQEAMITACQKSKYRGQIIVAQDGELWSSTDPMRTG